MLQVVISSAMKESCSSIIIMEWRFVFIYLLYSCFLFACLVSDHFYNLVVLTLHCMYRCTHVKAGRIWYDMIYPNICLAYSAKSLRAWLPLQGNANAAIHVSLRWSDHHDDASLLLLLRLLLFPLHSRCAFPVGNWAQNWKSLYEWNVFVCRCMCVCV